MTTAPSGLEGEGFPVRRAFAGVDLGTLDPFVHMDQMGEVDYAPGEPKGTPPATPTAASRPSPTWLANLFRGVRAGTHDPKPLGDFLARANQAVRQVFHGPVTYASLPFERADWSPVRPHSSLLGLAAQPGRALQRLSWRACDSACWGRWLSGPRTASRSRSPG